MSDDYVRAQTYARPSAARLSTVTAVPEILKLKVGCFDYPGSPVEKPVAEDSIDYAMVV